MADKITYLCENCGYESAKWLGKCPACNEWNTFIEQRAIKTKGQKASFSSNNYEKSEIISNVDLTKKERLDSGFNELNRVLGGGIVPGSVNLLGGDPGIGKSTILIQICSRLAKNGKKILYASGEESKSQIKMRALRVNAIDDNIYLMSQNELNDILSEAQNVSPEILVIDSIQTVYCADTQSASGTVSQIRECTMRLMRLAKSENICVFIIGHMTKDGNLAGPKVLEHMVDCVLYFEGEKQSSYRMIRSNKNRFGSSNEIAVFDMRETGLWEIKNPSALFISGRINGVAGSSVAAALEGTRPILAEIQALASKTGYNLPRRTGTGIDNGRLYMLLAVLEKRAGLNSVCTQDIYVNVTGGLYISEPACDLAIAMSIASSIKNIPLIHDCVFLGEVGLLGEIRTVSAIEKRLHEAQKLGFKKALIPYNNITVIDKKKYELELIPVKSIIDAFQKGFLSE